MEVELSPIQEDGNLQPGVIESSDHADNLRTITRHTSETSAEAAKQEHTIPLNPPKMAAMEIEGSPFEFIPPKDSILTFLADWSYTILIGILVVSFWRGGWVFLDHYSCGQPGTAGMLNGESFCFLGLGTVESYRLRSAIESLIGGYILFGTGVTLLSFGLWRPQKTFVKDAPTRLRPKKIVLRVLVVLLLGWGTLGIWRGNWYFMDYYVYPDLPYFSYQFTSILGAIICLSLCSAAAMLAPPAIFLMDGPSHLPPPIGVTIITSYRSITYPAYSSKAKTTKDPLWLVIVDIIISFIVLPIGVVGFWRGTWSLLDTWFWNFTDSQADVNKSILWSFLAGLGALFTGSEDIAQHFSPEKVLKSKWAITLANMTFGRIRTLILAFGAVNFWRSVWLFWDEFLTTHAWSAVLAHVLGIVGLLLLGCLSCITAPPSTLGVDAIAHPDCADEPLFHNTPVPWEVLYFTAIARRPEALLTHGIKGPDGSSRFDPDLLNDPSVRSTVSQNILPCVENLLVQDDYVYTDSARFSTRFTEQTSSNLQSATRNESSSSLRLSVRQMAKRKSSQFFRSR